MDPRATLLKFNLSSLVDCVMQSWLERAGEFGAIPQFSWNEAAIAFPYTSLPEMISLRISSHYADDGVTYASRENATAVPEMIVYYTLPQPTGSPTSEPTDSPVQVVPTASPTGKPSGSPIVRVPTGTPIGSPTYNPTEWPTYNPTVSPTWDGTAPPSTSPTVKPPDLAIPVSKDAMIGGGEYSNRRFGRDPFISIQANYRRAIFEFDLGEAKTSFDYQYTLQMYVTYVGQSQQRSVMASYVTQRDFGWNEDTVTWNNFGAPAMEQIGWFTIFQSDSESLVKIPLGTLFNTTVDGNRFIQVLENVVPEDEQNPGDKFDFRSREFATRFPGLADTPPKLVGVPELEEE